MYSNLTNDLYGSYNSLKSKWKIFINGGQLKSVQLMSGWLDFFPIIAA